MKFIDKTVLITGANRGIGKRLVDAVEKAGAAKIYAAARDANAVARTAGVVPLQLDVTDAASVAAAAAQAADAQCVVNNAGVLSFGDILSVEMDELERNLEVNLFGKLRVARAFAPIIARNGGGAFVNILTLVSLASMPGLSAYNASKAAAWSMSLSLRATLSDRGIAVHNVFPGVVDTDMLAGVEMPKTSPEDLARAIVAGVEAGDEDIFPDPMSQDVYAAWSKDHKAVEHQFARM